MALTKIGSIGINTGIQFAGVTTIATLNASDNVLSVGGTVNFVSDVSIGGSVSIGGTLTYEDVTNIDSVGLITARNGIVVGSGITLSKDGDIFATGITTVTDNVNIAADNKKLLIGASQDLELYHDGSHSFIENTGTGYLFLKDTGNLYVRTGDFRVQNAAGSETMLVGSAGGALSLNFAGSEKFTTSNTGVTITGDASFSGDISVNGGDVTVTGGEGTSAALQLIADQGDDNGDGWEIRSNQDDNDLTIKNNTSGSYADKFTLLKTGELTLTSDLIIPDKIIHSGDTNTAIRFPAADTFTVETGGSERARIDSSGDFGIGMSPSGVRLDVQSVQNDIARFSGANSGGITIRNDTNHEIQIHSGTSDALIFGTNGENERLRITSAGDVGIGENSPSNRLVVQKTNASGDVGIRIKNDTTTDGDDTNPTTASLFLNTSTADFNTFYIQARRNDNNTHFGYSDPRTGGHVPTMCLRSDRRINIGGGSEAIKFSGNGITIKGADNTGAAVIEQYTTTAGRGYKQSLVMGLASITSHNEVLRITGTGSNGFRMLVKIRVVGHTGAVGDGYRISEWYWTGGTNTPASIYNYQGGSVPSLQFDTSNTNIWIIRIGSSNQSNSMNGVVEFDVLVPVDFGGNTWTTTTAN